MSGEERRAELLKLIGSSGRPLSGAALAERFHVSRQVIVQDIALLRAAHYEILSTNRGYLLSGSKRPLRVFRVAHTDAQMQDELYTIVDCGGTVRDVFVEHEVYGELHAELNLCSRMQADRFLEGISRGESQPLKNITSGIHFHTVEAESETVLEAVGDALKRKGYLLPDPQIH